MHRVLQQILTLPRPTVEAAITRYREIQSGMTESMAASGYEEIVEPGLLTPDGRPVIEAGGRRWAHTPDVHAARVRDGLAAASARAKKTVPPTLGHGAKNCTALIDGQLCGGTLVRASVCPRCALGKSGVAATLTCDVCGHVTAIMRGDS